MDGTDAGTAAGAAGEAAQAVSVAAVPAAAAPQAEAQPAPVAAQPEDPAPKQATPPLPEELNPPVDLVGEFVPEVPPLVKLKWDSNNPRRYVEYCLVYREDAAQPGELKVTRAKHKGSHEDRDIEPGHTYVYRVTVVCKGGEESEPSEPVTVATQVMDAPAQPQGVTAVAIDPGVSLDWQPNPEANLAGYNVYRSFQGRWLKVNRQTVTDNHYYHDSGVGGQIYAVSAVNVYGIESGYAVVAAQQSAPVIYQEDDPAVSVEGFWAVERYEEASGGGILVALDAGNRLHFTFQGRQVKLIVARYWSCGNARLYIDGELMATVNLYISVPSFRSVELSVPGLKYGTHVLTVEVAGSGNPESEFNFVNVDAFEVR